MGDKGKIFIVGWGWGGKTMYFGNKIQNENLVLFFTQRGLKV